MRALLAAVAAVFALAAGSAHAEVIDQSAGGFSVKHTVFVAAPAGAAAAAFVDIGEWWDGNHTYTGDAANLSITPTVGGCWCERLPDGGFVEHMRLVYFVPGGGGMRFIGGLGPLQEIGANGALTVTFDEGAGEGSTITFSYVVNGYHPDGMQTLAGPVDFVIGAALQRLAEHLGGHGH